MKSKEFLKTWAMRAWEQDQLFEGDLTGGIAPRKRLVDCNVSGNTVTINYRLPEACGLSDVIYHVTDPYKLRTDVFVFEGDKILMNGELFPDERLKDPWLDPEEGIEFQKEYAAALRSLK